MRQRTKEETEQAGTEVLNHTLLSISKEIIGCSILLDMHFPGKPMALALKKNLAVKVDLLIRDFLGESLQCNIVSKVDKKDLNS